MADSFNFADPNSTYGGTGYGGGGYSLPGYGSNVDPNVLQAFLQNAPQVQQAQRRAQQLRGMAQGYQQMQTNPTGTGNMTPTQQGGLYQTVAQWHPDYAKAAQQITGALGNAAGTQQANTAEDQYNQLRNAQVLRAVQQMGSNGGVMGGGAFGSGNLYPGQGQGWAGANAGY
jgi:hypothetical protein